MFNFIKNMNLNNFVEKFNCYIVYVYCQYL